MAGKVAFALARTFESTEESGERLSWLALKKVAALMTNGGCGLIAAFYNPRLAIPIYSHST